MALGVTWLDLYAQPVLSPKHGEAVASMGKPMFKMSDLIPKSVTIIVPPPAMTNRTVRIEGLNGTNGETYQVFIGTNFVGDNFVGTVWLELTTNSTYSRVIRVLDNTAYFFSRVAISRGTERWYWSELLREPNFEFNFVRMKWFPPVQALFCKSPDMRFWVCYNATPPVTNAIVPGGSQFYMCQSPAPNRVVMDITPLREWNGKYYGR